MRFFLPALPTPSEIATDELDGAKRDLLKAQSGLDYAKAMVSYHQERILRLQLFLESEARNADKNRRNTLPS